MRVLCASVVYYLLFSNSYSLFTYTLLQELLLKSFPSLHTSQPVIRSRSKTIDYLPVILGSPQPEVMYENPVTLVSVTYGADDQLHQNVISGPNLAVPCPSEEGLYILYQDRGLQIAAAECDQRRCSNRHVCHCTEQQHQCIGGKAASYTQTDDENPKYEKQPTQTRTGAYYTTNRKDRRDQYRAPAWLHLYEAAEHIRSSRLCFLAHPRTLTRYKLFGSLAFYFNTELEEHDISTRTHRCLPLPQRNNNRTEYLRCLAGLGGGPTKDNNNNNKPCPPDLLEFIRDSWTEFLDCGGYESRESAVIALSDESYAGDNSSDDDNDSDGPDEEVQRLSEWDWDDAGVLIHTPAASSPIITAATAVATIPTPPPSPSPSPSPESAVIPIPTLSTTRRNPRKRRSSEIESYDFFNDIIEEEFPRVIKKMRQQQQQQQQRPKTSDTDESGSGQQQQQQRQNQGEREQGQEQEKEKEQFSSPSTGKTPGNGSSSDRSCIPADTADERQDGKEDDKEDDEDDDVPAPIIIPPKNMSIAHALSLHVALDLEPRQINKRDWLTLPARPEKSVNSGGTASGKGPKLGRTDQSGTNNDAEGVKYWNSS